MIVLRQVSKYVYDVFSGTGWPILDAHPWATDGAWSRVRLNTWGVVVLAGRPRNRGDCQRLEKLINRLPYGSVEPVRL